MGTINDIYNSIVKNYPDDKDIYFFSTQNELPQNWMLYTPYNVWDKTIPMPEKGDGAFGLKPCSQTGPNSGKACARIEAAVTDPGESIPHLSAGHSYVLYEKMYQIMVGAEKFLDVTTLSEPTGMFLDVLANALAYISNKPEGKRPVVRILWSVLAGAKAVPKMYTAADKVLGQLTEKIEKTSKMEIYLGMFSSSRTSWNHAKIIAADGQRSLVGGHNMWESHYLGQNPVFDVSMTAEGQCTLAAHEYADVLWGYMIDRTDVTYHWVENYIRFETYTRAAYKYDDHEKTNKIISGVLPDKKIYRNISSSFAREQTSPRDLPILAVGRRAHATPYDSAFGYAFPTLYYFYKPNNEPADTAILQMIDGASQSVKMSLQALSGIIPSFIIDNAPASLVPDFGVWNSDIFVALANAILRGVEIKIVTSNPNALAGTKKPAPGVKSPPPDPSPPSYDSVSIKTINTKMLSVLTKTLKVSEQEAELLIDQRFKVANFRYTTNPADQTYPQNAPVPNHAKTFIVDDKIFYIGSQNLYPSNLNEFGYILEDTSTASAYLSNYWNPLWNAAESTLSSSFNAEEKDAYEIKTRKIFNDFILNAGYSATIADVFDLLNSDAFKQNSRTNTPNTASDQFVLDLYKDKNLLEEFLGILVQKKEASDQTVDAFLKSKGYDCTVEQVNASFTLLPNRSLAYWTGLYEDAWIIEDDGAFFDSLNISNNSANKRMMLEKQTAEIQYLPPLPEELAKKASLADSLVIPNNTDASIGKDHLMDPLYQSGMLSWNTGQGLTANKTSGKILFSEIR